MSCELVIQAEALSKCFHIYDKPRDRLLQMFAGASKQFYKEFWALKDVSFKLKRGETVGIIGKNGSGKSTLLQMICGTLTPSTGSVQVAGKVAAILELGSAFNPEFSGRENVYLNAALYGLTRAQVDERFDRIAAFADIGDFIDHPIKIYSTGMYVRLAFAVIAHVDADVLIIDEALAVGDAAFTRKCMRFLRGFMETGTVLFVSHDTAAVKSLCNRAVWLHDGQLMLDGDPKAVSEAYLKHLYESQQGQSAAKPQIGALTQGAPTTRRDMRLDVLNHSNLRNDIEVFPISPEAKSFGKGGATLRAVELLDLQGRPLAWVVGGETVQLVIRGQALEPIEQVVVGFALKDRLGQYLFADNTYLGYLDTPISLCQGEQFTAQFQFAMPILRAGDYGVDVAVADGTQTEHIQQLWVHDALTLKSATSSVCNGLVGIPMEHITLTVERHVEQRIQAQDKTEAAEYS